MGKTGGKKAKKGKKAAAGEEASHDVSEATSPADGDGGGFFLTGVDFLIS